MVAALQQDLVTAESNRLVDLLIEFFARQDIRVVVAGLAVEGAEIADCRADVRVVNIAVDVVSAIRLGMESPGDAVGGAAKRGQIVAVEESDAFVVVQPFAGDRFVEDYLHSHGGPLTRTRRRVGGSTGGAAP